MRHFLTDGPPGAVTSLAGGMAEPARPAVLIAAAGGAEGGPAGALGTGP